LRTTCSAWVISLLQVLLHLPIRDAGVNGSNRRNPSEPDNRKRNMTTEYKASESGFHYIRRNQGKWFVTGIVKRKFRVADLKRLSSKGKFNIFN
jgi:hypothetical protein